jgi:Tol biopolymer transport system component
MKRSAVFALLIALAGAGCRTERNEMPRLASVASSVQGAPEVTVRRLYTSGYVDFYVSSISPDGRYLSMVDWSTTDLAVRDLETGELHRLTNAPRSGDDDEPYQDANVSVFSPDGYRLIYGWQYYPDLQLRVLDFETDDSGKPVPGESRVVFHNPEFYPYYPFDWSPDGSRVLAKVYAAGNTNQLALISTSDGTYSPLKSFDWREPTRAGFSPDGRYIAYDFMPDVDSPNRDIAVLAVDGTADSRIVEGPAIDQFLGWHSNGGILFRSDRNGVAGIWWISVTDGRATGPAELVRPTLENVEALGFAGDRFYYGVRVNPERVYTATVDLEAGRLTSEATMVDDPARIDIRGWDWSPDGRYLAHSGTVPGINGSVITIQAENGDNVRSFRLDLSATSRIRWMPDGKSLIAYARDNKARRGFHRIDLETGTYETVLRSSDLEESTPRGDFDISADGRTLWFATTPPSVSDSATLIARDLATGSSRQLVRVAWPGKVARSPDGDRLAIVGVEPESGGSWQVISTIPVDGGPALPLSRIPAGHLIWGLGWHPDGRYIYFSTIDPSADKRPWQMWIVPAEGGERRPVKLLDHVNPPSMRFHPDGRRITFKAGQSRGEVWVLDGLGEGTGPADRPMTAGSK